MKTDSVCSSAEDIEAIVRGVLAEVLSKQHSGGEQRSHTSGGPLNLEDFELPDDLGSMFTAVTLPNEIKDEAGKEGGDGLVSGKNKSCCSISSSSFFLRPSSTFLLYTERRRHG